MRSGGAPVERTDGRVRIRPYCADDIDRLYEAVRESMDDLMPWLPWCHADYTREESAAWVAARPEAWTTGEAYSFAVVDARDGAFLGGCGLNQVNRVHRFANLGYWVRSRCTGAGVATRAARLVARFGFEALGLHRIEIVTALDNVASQRVAEKAGAVREGVLRKRIAGGATPQDAIMFSLVPGDLAGIDA